MNTYDLTHLRDDALLRGLDSLAAQDRTTTANLLAHIAEVDARKLYAPAGYSSMHAYCVGRLHLSEGSAWKRVTVARKARIFPCLLSALADGRVHLSGLVLLAAHLTSDNADELIKASTHRRKAEIERMLAQRFPQVEVLRLDDGVAALGSRVTAQLSPGTVVPPAVAQSSPAPLVPATPVPSVPARVAPITAERFSLQVTIDRTTHDQLRYAQELMGHGSGDVSTVLRRALDLLVGELEKRKFAKVARPSQSRGSKNRRSIGADVKRKVWARDGGRCTYVARDGHRCEERRALEFDHITPVALGGKGTVDQVRLRCRSHNQLEAERVFGKAFMEEKRSRIRTA